MGGRESWKPQIYPRDCQELELMMGQCRPPSDRSLAELGVASPEALLTFNGSQVFLITPYLRGLGIIPANTQIRGTILQYSDVCEPLVGNPMATTGSEAIACGTLSFGTQEQRGRSVSKLR